MSFEQLAEDHDDFYAPAFEIRVGKPAQGFASPTATYDGSQGVVADLRIDTNIDQVNRFSFTLEDCFDRTADSDGAFDEDLRSTFEEGTALDVRAGYGGSASESLLWGRVDTVKPTFPSGGSPSLSVSGFDLTNDLKEGSGSGKWEETDLDSVVEELVSDPPFDGTEVDAGSPSIDTLHHSENSDYRFLTTLADRHDCEQFSRAGTYYFREQSAAGDSSAVATLEYGRALRSFTPGSDNPRSSSGSRGSQPTVGTVKVRHNDEVKKEAIVGEASVEGGGDEERVETAPVRSTDEAERRAEAIAGAIERTGDDNADPGDGRDGDRAETLGLPELQVGTVVKLGGIGEKFSGEYYVESATHRLDDAGYTTSFSVRRLTNE